MRVQRLRSSRGWPVGIWDRMVRCRRAGYSTGLEQTVRALHTSTQREGFLFLGCVFAVPAVPPAIPAWVRPTSFLTVPKLAHLT